MKKLFTAFLLLGMFSVGFSQLSAGDIAITGINADNPDDFSFVALVDIPSGTEIYFTDSGVKSDGTFRGNEGGLKYTAPSDISAGTLITYQGNNADFTTANDGNVGTNGFNLSGSGDQVIAFIGSSSSPVFIFAAQINSNVWQSDATASTNSALPPGLTNGETAVAAGAGSGAGDEYDNAAYDESVLSGTQSELLAAIADNANWNGDNSNRYDLASQGPYTVSSGTKPEPSNHVTDFTATANSSSQIDLSWTDATGSQLPDKYLIKMSTGSITDPVDGTEEADGSNTINIAYGIEAYSWTGLTANTTYHFKIYPYTNSGTDIDYKTDGTVPSADATTYPVYDSDTDVLTGTQPASANISSVANNSAGATSVLEFTISDQGTSDGLATKVTNIRIVPAASNTADWTDHLAGVVLTDKGAGTDVTIGAPTITDTYIDIPVSAGNLDVTDGASTTIILKIWLNNTATIADNEILSFQINSSAHGFTADGSGSQFANTFTADITSNDFTVDVTATKLAVKTQPSDVQTGAAISPAVEIYYSDANGNRDVDADGSPYGASMSTTGTFDPSATTSAPAVNGLMTFANLVFSAEGTGITLTAADANTGSPVTQVTTDAFNVSSAPNARDVVISEIMYNSPGVDEEWIEIYNRSSKNFTLNSDWTLENSSPSWTYTFDGSKSIAPGEYLTIEVGSSGDFPFAPDFVSSTSDNQLVNSTSTITLKYSGSTINEVTYDDGSPWPTTPDGNGPSLERVDMDLADDSDTNFAASLRDGGTPGYENQTSPDQEASAAVSTGSNQSAPIGSSTAIKQLDITTVTNAGDVTVQYYEESPASPTGISGHASNYRWIISPDAALVINEGDGYTITFNLADLQDYGGINEGASDIHLYKRHNPGTGSFSDMGVLTYYDNGTPGDQSDDYMVSPLITDGFSEYAFGTSGDSPLPIELQSFTASAGDREVLLKWKTASESENAGFIIYRAEGAEEEYLEIASYRHLESLEGLGTSSEGKSYAYSDRDVTLKNGHTYYYKLADVDFNGSITLHGPISATPHIESDETGEVHTFRLEQNYPNPFNPSTVIRVSLDKPVDNAEISVYDMSGRLVKNLFSGPINGYSKTVEWDGTDNRGVKVSSGIYFYRYKAVNRIVMKKMLLVK